MKKSSNEKVQLFLNQLMISDPEKFEILIAMRKIIFSQFPESEERMMYGGILFAYENEDYSGLFVRKHHISLEFSTGFNMKDPNKHLEGSGKFRRHLKIRNKQDISLKEVAYYVEQAL